MNKFVLTIAIILGMGIGAFAQEGGGLFGRGPERQSTSYFSKNDPSSSLLNLPAGHGSSQDQAAPLGSGALLLIGLGAAYATAKKKENR